MIVPEVDIFATCAARDAASGKDAPANISGSLGLRYRGSVYVVAGLINVASKDDTIRTNHGSTLLVPSAGRGLNAGLLDIRAPRWPFHGVPERCALPGQGDAISCHWGFHVYFSTSAFHWATQTDAATRAVTRADVVPVWGSGWGVTYTFMNGALTDDNAVGMVLDILVATRHLRGDLTAEGEIRQDLLGTRKKDFIGSEISLNLHYNTVQAGLTYYFMTGDVKSFSRGQVVAGVSMQANFNSKPLKR